MGKAEEPWLRHPIGVWTQHPRDDGSSVLVDFGGDVRIAVAARHWPSPPAGVEPPGTPIGDRRFHVDEPLQQGNVRIWRARTWLGSTEVLVTLAEDADLPDEHAYELLCDALLCLDYERIQARSATPRRAPATAADLVPWILLPDHPAAHDLGCAVLPNGLLVAIAIVQEPHVHLIGSDHELTRALSSEELVRLAVTNLVNRLARKELPTELRSIDETHTLAIGPHLLASSCLLLPDLRLWAQEATGIEGNLYAVALRRDLLLVLPESVERPEDTWAPPLLLT